MNGITKTDWHRADILAAVRKKKKSLAALSREHNLSSGTLINALQRHWPRGEEIISEAIGVAVEEIWPSRYTQNKKPRKVKAQGRKPA